MQSERLWSFHSLFYQAITERHERTIAIELGGRPIFLVCHARKFVLELLGSKLLGWMLCKHPTGRNPATTCPTTQMSHRWNRQQ